MRVLIVGCGYVGLAAGARLAREGHVVSGLRRNPAAEFALREVGIAPLHADITFPESLQRIPPEFDWVVNCAAPPGGGAEAYEATYVQGTRNLVAWLLGSSVKKYVYTSSTGVYGQDDGSLVDESAITEPATETGLLLVKAERLLFDAARESRFPGVVLRVAGIYGPGRGYWLKQFLSGEATLDGTGSRILNMIHRDDLVGSICAALQKGAAGDICNVVDDEPATQRVVFEWLARKLGKPMPPSAPTTTAESRRRGPTNKRISNDKLRRAYGYILLYPTFREGFAAELHSTHDNPQ